MYSDILQLYVNLLDYLENSLVISLFLILKTSVYQTFYRD